MGNKAYKPRRDKDIVYPEMRDNCGVVVAYGVRTAYELISKLQHRGQDMVGFGVLTKTGINIVKYAGAVKQMTCDSLLSSLSLDEDEINNSLVIAHVKYRTTGGIDLLGAHPQWNGDEREFHQEGSRLQIIYGAEKAVVHNGDCPNYHALRAREERDGYRFKYNCDSEVFLPCFEKGGIEGIMQDIPAAYVAALMTEAGVRIFKDRFGIRPGWFGRDDEGRPLFASEDVAIQQCGYTPVREIGAGENVIFHRNYNEAPTETRIVIPEIEHPCIFEWQYLMRVLRGEDGNGAGSTFCGASSLDVRRAYGPIIADSCRDLDVDYVSYFPHSPWAAAETLAEALGVEFADLMIKLRSQRSFLEPTMELRWESILENLMVNPRYAEEIGKGARVLMVDDSLIRRIVSSVGASKLYEAGAEWLGLALYTDMIGDHDRGCCLGVAMPPSGEFITSVAGRDTKAIRKMIGYFENYRNGFPGLTAVPDRELDFLSYMPVDRMTETVKHHIALSGRDPEKYDPCTICMTGDDGWLREALKRAA